ncbi:MAG: RnfABCDGE type electron transport complex subunit D, partial [Pseudomonadota bacterium]
VGYAVVLISYPLDVSTWVELPHGFQLSFTQALAYSFNGGLSQSVNYDALTGATALSQYYELALQGATDDDISQAVRGSFGARHSEWLNLAFLAGGLILLGRRIISWHLPVAVLTGIILMHLLAGSAYPDLWFHWFGGATMLCAFFIVTDPVSAPASHRARLVFGLLVGMLTYLIRQYGSYPDSVAFAVLLMNCCVPLLDKLDNRLRRRSV